ncbi:MAG: hypothetical protein R2832_18540 [Rhodothermales bacterium]
MRKQRTEDMNKQQQQFAIWTGIAGVIFLFVGGLDVLTPANDGKSWFVVGLEFVSGLFFVANAIVQWRRAHA